ncbi:hypothetical protein FLP30_13105 (plasmid) [Acetobacter vaccinii]|uniref:Uncharacterized protein n=1 Tax=Acetobacter vaccinii TaxID=2592655 RepID=A0A5C1YTA2_9PROT|nr:hypothetical protein FLP30_13105 [Acetobacter vaccinii]
MASAVRKGNFVYVYDEQGRQLTTIAAGGGSHDGLQGYTATTVSVRKGSFIYIYIYIYDERSHQKSAIPAR